jgi:hypothetical protein
MPRLEEVTYYIQGVWLLLKGKPEAFAYLDFSERGFWRSWWALVYCLPPTLLSYLALKMQLASLGPPTEIGNDVYLKAALVDYGSVLISVTVFFWVARLGGFGQFAAPIIIALNWLAVPLQWAFSIENLLEIYVPGSTALTQIMQLFYLLLGTFLSYQLISRIVGGHSLVTITAFLTLNVVSLLTQYKIGLVVSLWP